MSAELEERVRESAPRPTGGLDMSAVRARTRQLRRRRTATFAGGGVGAVVAVAAVAVVVVGQSGRAPVIDAGPVSSPTATPPSETASPTQSAAVADPAWHVVEGGQSLSIPGGSGWDGWPTHVLAPTVEADWSAEVRDAIHEWTDRTAPASDAATAGDLHMGVSIGPQRQLLFEPATDPGGILVVDADGRQRVVDLDARRATATWAPAGYWLVLTERTDGTVVVHRLTDTGQVTDTVALDGYRPEWAGVLLAKGDEIWVWSSFERVDDRGVQMALLATDGGDTIIEPIEWRPADEVTDLGAADPDYVEAVYRPRSRTFEFPVEGGHAAVRVDRSDEGPAMRNVEILRRTDRWIRAGGYGFAFVVHPDDHADEVTIVMLATDRAAYVTGFSEPGTISLDYSKGRPWYVEVSPSGYRLTDLSPPE